MPHTGYSKYQKSISTIVDTIILIGAFLGAFYIRFNTFLDFHQYDFLALLLIYLIVWWVLANISGFTLGQRGVQFDKVLLKLFRNIILHGIAVFSVIVVLKFYNVSRLMVGYAFGIQAMLLLLWRISYSWILKSYRRAGYNFRNVVILGTNENAIQLYKTLTGKKSYGYHFIGFFCGDSERTNVGECPVYDLSEFEIFACENNIDEVFTTLTDGYEDRIREIIRYCENNLIRFKLVPNFQRYIKKKVTVSFIEGTPLILLREEPLESLFSRGLKRGFDIIFSLLVTVLLLSWLIPLIGLIIRLESKGPIFFIQKRTGKDNKEFPMIKFRSMAVNKDADNIQATKNDMRVTKVGKFMRKTSIDELPQFLNALVGHMSVVGPRPHMLKHTEEYSELINKYMVRHFVKPGITGWAQVNGYRGETETTELMQKRVEHDMWYIENWSFVLDLMIVVKTVTNAVKGEEKAF